MNRVSMRRRGVFSLLAVALLSLAVLFFHASMARRHVRVVYHGEAEWMMLLVTARHAFASNSSLHYLVGRLRAFAASKGVWLPNVTVNYVIDRSLGENGWVVYRAWFVDERGNVGFFIANFTYVLVSLRGVAGDSRYGVRVYNISYVHVYKLPQYGYNITIHPILTPLCNATLTRIDSEYVLEVQGPGSCVLVDRWGARLLVPGV